MQSRNRVVVGGECQILSVYILVQKVFDFFYRVMGESLQGMENLED